MGILLYSHSKCTLRVQIINYSELVVALISLLSRRISVIVLLLAVVDELANTLRRPGLLGLLLTLMLLLRLLDRLVVDRSHRHV